MTPSIDSVLLDYQKRWLNESRDIRICVKSRRIGITYAEAAAAALLAAQRRGGGDTLYTSYNFEISRDFIREVAQWASFFQLAASEVQEVVIRDVKQDIMAYRVMFDSGHQVLGLPGNPNNLRGRKAARVIIDEAAFVEDLYALLQAAMPLRIWGAKLSIISTHNGISSHFNEIVEDIRSGKRRYALHSIDIHQACQQGLYERICLVKQEEWTQPKQEAWVETLLDDSINPAEEYLCVPAQMTDLVYLPALIVKTAQSDQYPMLRLELPDTFVTRDEYDRVSQIDKWCTTHLDPLIQNVDPSYKTYVGLDFGRVSDLTSIALLVEYSGVKLDCPWILELRNCPFEAQRQILFYLLTHLPWWVRCSMDATGSGSYLAEVTQQKFGSRVTAIKLSPKFYVEEFPSYKASLQDGVLTIPGNRDVLEDHKLVRLKEGVPKIPADARFKGEDGKLRHGDSAIALLLAHHAATQKTVVVYPGNLFKKITA